MKYLFYSFIFILGALDAQKTEAQVNLPGAHDTSFNMSRPNGFFTNPMNPLPGEGAIGTIFALAIQPDGKAVIAGNFSAYNGKTHYNVARILPDGSNDSTFQSNFSAAADVLTLMLQHDGKIIMTGEYFYFNGPQRHRMVRLLHNGQLDTSFNLGSGVNGPVRAHALLTNGKLMIAGEFTTIGGVVRNRIARLHSNGSIDTSFNPGAAADGNISAMVMQPDGKIIIAGAFTSYASVPRKHIARIHADGTLDTTFHPGSGPSLPIHAIGLQPSGKLFVSGIFLEFDGRPMRCLARLNADGSLDTTANLGTGINSIITTFSVMSNGKIVINGLFDEINNNSYHRIARLNADGSVDTTFDIGSGTVRAITGTSAFIYANVIQADGKILVGGSFETFNGLGTQSINRLAADGSNDLTFNPRIGLNGSVLSLARLSDGRFYVAGTFASYNNIPYPNILRLFPDGRLDTSFNIGTGPNYFVSSVSIQPDGKIIIGGGFTEINGSPKRFIARLHANGNVDSTFDAGSGPNPAVLNTILQPDGKVLIQGLFGSVNGTSSPYVARLHANGQFDSSFQIGTFGTNNSSLWIHVMALQPDGKILIGGEFGAYNFLTRRCIVRLNTDGSLDSTFSLNTAVFGVVRAIVLQPNGKVLVGGEFRDFIGTKGRIARLNADGTLDASFSPQGIATHPVYSMALQTDGSIVVGGTFTAINGVSRNRIARMLPNGGLDTTFNPGTGLNAISYTMLIQPDEKILVGGGFSLFDDRLSPRIVRIHGGDCAAIVTNTTSPSAICVGDSKNLIGTAGGHWVINSGPGSIVGQTYISSNTAGTVSIVNRIGSCTSRVVTFEVDSLPQAPVLSPIPNICAGNTATISPISGGTSYHFWLDSVGGTPLNGAAGVSSFTTPVLTNNTQFYVSSLNTVGCESNTRSVVVIEVLPSPTVTISQQNDTLRANASTGILQWFRDSLAISGANDTFYVTTQSGYYWLQVTHAQGCSTNSNVVNVFATKVDESHGKIQWSAYPVPFDTQLNITSEVPFAYELLDVRGKMLLQGSSEDQSTTLETASLACGVYLIKILANGRSHLKRVVKR